MEELFPGGPKGSIEIRKEEVKRFYTDQYSYCGVTLSGFLFNIIRYKTYNLDIEDPDDYFGYMWLECVDGFYLLRQRMLQGYALPWVLEVEIIPEEKDHEFFYSVRDFLSDNTDKLFDICGEPLEQEIPKDRKPYYMYPE